MQRGPAGGGRALQCDAFAHSGRGKAGHTVNASECEQAPPRFVEREVVDGIRVEHPLQIDQVPTFVTTIRLDLSDPASDVMAVTEAIGAIWMTHSLPTSDHSRRRGWILT